MAKEFIRRYTHDLTSDELGKLFTRETPEAYQYLLDDLFETITLYDNRALSATMTKSPAGGWDVTLKVKSRKLRADEQGKQTELDFEDFMDVGALDEQGVALWLERRKVPKGESEVRFTVPTRPAKVGLDPLNKLIDRDSGDNVTVPTEESPS